MYISYNNIRGGFIVEKFTRRGERRFINQQVLSVICLWLRSHVHTDPAHADFSARTLALDRLHNGIPRSPMLTRKNDRRKSKASG